jgi:hypothetical protein
MVFPYDDGFQTIGFQGEGNSNPRDLYSISGTGLGVNKGALIVTANFSYPISFGSEATTRLSRTWSAAVATSIGGTNYINYGVHGVDAYVSEDFTIGNVINSPFDGYVFRVRPSSATLSGLPELQVCHLPVTNGWTDISLGAYKPRTNVFFRMDSAADTVYIFATKIVGGSTHLLGLNSTTYAIETDILISETITSASAPGDMRPYNIGNMVTVAYQVSPGVVGIEFRLYQNLTPAQTTGGGFLLLQRDGSDFHIVEQEGYPIRVDISNTSPVFTVGSGDGTFVSNYIYGNDLEVIEPAFVSSGRMVSDYRYTLLEPTFGASASGLGVTTLGLYVLASGVFGQDIRTYSGGWQAMYQVPSGFGFRLETSNYGLNGQYVFVTASGYIQTFYQKNPDEGSFLSYSGMPQSRATIIRLDDRI